ncbi:MAG: VCBS repeat-containing protein [Ferruginibacter sp.]
MLSPFILLYLLFHFTGTDPVSFEEQVIDNNISIGYGLALGDVDGDGKPDILLADKKQFVWYRNGDWKKFLLAENLTAHDNVCIAARDIDGDGKVEIAVGAQWNPSETSNIAQSGSVHYLVRPADVTRQWTAVSLPHEPTVHRMKWLQSSQGKFYLLVAPLHGRGNINGAGAGANIIAYEYPGNINKKWPMHVLDTSMHLTHNFCIVESKDQRDSGFYLAGKEGVKFIGGNLNGGLQSPAKNIPCVEFAAGEIKTGKAAPGKHFIVTVEPMHGDKIVIYRPGENGYRSVIDDNIKEGHALAVADFLGTGTDQVIAGWRAPNRDSLTGIKLYIKKEGVENQWESRWVDRNGIACEDMQVMDLNQDGKPDIVASGRATHNIKIYWNRSK